MTGYPSSACPAEVTLAAFVGGELGPEERAPLEEHLAGCDACLTAVAAATMASNRSRALSVAEGDGSATEEFGIGRLIAQGGMGAVYEGRDKRTGQVVAIKRLMPELADGGSELRLRFEREGEILRQLDHPNIVKMLATFVRGEQLHIVMEYVGGGSLRDLLKTQSRMSFERSARIVLELCDALARAHHLAVIHRDIKPENVLLAVDGTPRLSDFGLARMGSQTLTRSGTLIGTVAYQSPEALWGRRVDERADIWALGVTLFEMLAGRRPFAGFHPATILSAILHQPAPKLGTVCPDAPRPLSDLVERMLEKDPERRIASARQVGAEIENILRTLPVHEGRLDVRRAEAEPALAVLRPLNDLPLPSAPMVNRDAELQEIMSLVTSAEQRLVTIVGASGVGKTRVALELAHRLTQEAGRDSDEARDSERFRRGAFFVDVQGLDSVYLLTSAIADALALQLHPGVDSRRQLIDYLREKSLLLLLDNLAQSVEGATLVSDLHEAAPRLVILATSRQRLRLHGEVQIALDGMACPASGNAENIRLFGATTLFLQQAQRVRPGFEPTTFQQREILRLCRYLHGIPLGVLLAANAMRRVEASDIEGQLWRNIGRLRQELLDTFAPHRSAPAVLEHSWLLPGGTFGGDQGDSSSGDPGGVPDRDLSLRAMFDISWSLLDGAGREALARLSVLHGPFDHAAAAAISGANESLLDDLVGFALLQYDSARNRFEMHDRLKEYSLEKLREDRAEHDRALDAMAGYYAGFLRDRRVALEGANPQPVVREIERSIRDVRSAWARMIEQQQFTALSEAIESLHLFYFRKTRFAEGEASFAMAAAALELLPSADVVRAKLAGRALGLQALYCVTLGKQQQALELATRALQLLNEGSNPLEAGQALITQGMALCALERMLEGTERVERGLVLQRSAPGCWESAQALTLLGHQRQWVGPARARACLEESVAVQASFGEQVTVLPHSLSALGAARLDTGQYLDAIRLFSEALEIGQQQGDRWIQSLCMRGLAGAHRALGKYAEAETFARNNLMFVEEFFPFAKPQAHLLLGEISKEQRRFDEAWVHCQLGLKGASAFTRSIAQIELGEVAWLRREASEAQRYWADSLETLERLGNRWELVVVLDNLGYIACQEEQLALAQEYFERAGELALSSQLWPRALSVLAGIALCVTRSGEALRGARLASAIDKHSATESRTRILRTEPLLTELATVLSTQALRDMRELAEPIDIQRELCKAW